MNDPPTRVGGIQGFTLATGRLELIIHSLT
jgi:hypothetical protein